MLSPRHAEASCRRSACKAQVAPGDSRDQLLAKLLAYTHGQVRYTGLELGERAILPTPPGETLTRHYGDCKDKSTLLVSLLRAAGLDASVALLRSGNGADVPSDLPGFGLFDHAIVYVEGEQPVWIDPTALYSPAGVLPYGDQDRLALVTSSKSKSLVRTPRSSAAQSAYEEEVLVDFPQLGKAKVTETVRGAESMLAALRGEFDKDQDQLKEQLKRYASERYGATLVRAQAAGASDLSQPFELVVEAIDAESLRTHADGGSAEVTAHQMYMHLPKALYQTPESERSEQERLKDKQNADPRYHKLPSAAVYLAKPHRYVIRYRLRVPDGFVWQALPDPLSLEAEGLRVSRRAALANPREAQVTFELESKGRTVPAARLEAVRKVLHAFDQQSGAARQYGSSCTRHVRLHGAHLSQRRRSGRPAHVPARRQAGGRTHQRARHAAPAPRHHQRVRTRRAALGCGLERRHGGLLLPLAGGRARGRRARQAAGPWGDRRRRPPHLLPAARKARLQADLHAWKPACLAVRRRAAPGIVRKEAGRGARVAGVGGA